MRQSLMNTFNEIYILDLHGNALKKERCPDGSKDENVFDIRQGVAIALFIKERNNKKECKVYHSEVWGLENKKDKWLLRNNLKTIKWKKLSPKPEYYLFIPRDEILLGKYNKYLKITNIFPINSVGIVTSRDSFVIDIDKEKLKRRIRMFRDEKIPDEQIKQTFDLKDKSNWNLKTAREKVMKEEDWGKFITQILYRPFDIQWIFYNDAVIERSRKEVMQHMMKENLGLISVRQVAEGIFNHVFVSESIVESRITLSNKGIGYIFPLYLYPEKSNPKKQYSGSVMMLFEPKADYKVRKPNLSQTIVKQIVNNFRKEIPPEQIFYYIYAALYSNTYRTKYAEFLKIDFPRIPFTKDYELFCKMSKYGEKLIDLHLLRSIELDFPVAKFPIAGDNKVEKPKYNEKTKRVYINTTQYFEPVKKEVWYYQIGGYQVCDKWLKDRKGRTLSLDDIKHYCKIVTVLRKTIEIQREIDDVYPLIENNILLINLK
jgi:predicted helicase